MTETETPHQPFRTRHDLRHGLVFQFIVGFGILIPFLTISLLLHASKGVLGWGTMGAIAAGVIVRGLLDKPQSSRRS